MLQDTMMEHGTTYAERFEALKAEVKAHGKRQAHLVDLHVGERVRRRRMAIDMSQQTLAVEMGVTFQQLQKYECGENRISAGRLYWLAKALKVPVGHFFEGCNEAGRPASARKKAA